jgi:hypothetical protein
MPSPEEVYRDIEIDRALRENEIRLIENIAPRTENENERGMLRRSLVLLIYAHLEGSCKFSLTAYASAINGLTLPCREAATALVAATLGRVFAALRDVNSKHPEFARLLPDDRELHLLTREQAFLEAYDAITGQRVEIPDRLIDTRSNLNSVLLKRLLYQLGLNYPVVDQQRSNMDMLLGVRNAKAHGDVLKVPTEREVQSYTSAAFEVMRFVQDEIYSALREERYRKLPARQAITDDGHHRWSDQDSEAPVSP